MSAPIDLKGLPRLTLLLIAERACNRLCGFANMLTTDEGDAEDTEDEFGLPAAEIVGMAHDNMIAEARATLDSINAEIAAADTSARQTEPREES